MKKPPAKEDTIIRIDDKETFGAAIKEKVLNFYIVTFNNYKEFMDVYDDRKLTNKIIQFWISQYTFLDDDGRTLIYSSDYESLVGRLYKEYCQVMMNKLVDTGHLQLLWDKKKKIVYWKKTRV
jgi:transcriptional regulator with PAS, ATPase and Fis domain